MMRGVRVPRLWPGFLAILLLLCIGVGLVSAALPDDAEDSGYYDGDGDDAVATPQRLAILVDVAVSARAGTVPVRTPEAFDGFSAAQGLTLGLVRRVRELAWTTMGLAIYPWLGMGPTLGDRAGRGREATTVNA